MGACQTQGEGGVCNPSATDCGNNLSCVQLPTFGYRCCPVAPAQPTTQVCTPNNASVNDANVPPTGGADAEAGTPAADAGEEIEAEVDAPAEALGSPVDAADGSDAPGE